MALMVLEKFGPTDDIQGSEKESLSVGSKEGSDTVVMHVAALSACRAPPQQSSAAGWECKNHLHEKSPG